MGFGSICHAQKLSKWQIGFTAATLQLTIFRYIDKTENSDYHPEVDSIKLQVVADERAAD